MIDEGIHISRADTKKEPGSTEPEQIGIAVKIRLSDDSHSVTGRFQHSANQRDAKGRVVHIGVSAHQYDIQAVPVAGSHILSVYR